MRLDVRDDVEAGCAVRVRSYRCVICPSVERDSAEVSKENRHSYCQTHTSMQIPELSQRVISGHDGVRGQGLRAATRMC